MNRRQIIFSYGGLFFVALIVRLTMAGFANYGEIKTVRPDTDGYLTPAWSMVHDGSYDSTRRPPGLPVVAAAVFKCGGTEKVLSFILAALSSFTVLIVARSGFLYGGHKGGIISGILYAFNPTVLGNSPLLLTDTLAGIGVALQYWLFLEFFLKKRNWGFFASVAVAALGVLIRPVNSLFILPLLFLMAWVKHISWKKKLLYAAGGATLFFAVICPWMFRNYVCGAGFCVDTNTGAMYHQNGAMLLGEVNGRGYEYEKQRIIAEQEQLFKDSVRFPDEASRERYRISEYKKLVRTHWRIWLKQQCNYQILLPDIPSFMECLGVTSSDRGTMAVLKEQGIMAAVYHYFGDKWLSITAALLPLLIVAGITYLGCGIGLIQNFCRFKTDYMEIFIFGAFVVYYLFLPGAITAPRYQIPALPCMCVVAAVSIGRFINKFCHRGQDVEVSNGEIVEKKAE